MMALRAIAAMSLLVAMLACGAGVRPVAEVMRPDPSERPVALALIGLRSTAPAPGRIVGYVTDAPLEDGQANLSSRRMLFTYVIDFRTVEVAPLKRPTPRQAEGIRRIYFHPDGARASFADPESFAGEDPVMTQRVRFRFDFSTDWRSLTIHILSGASKEKPFTYAGRSVELPKQWQAPSVLFGQPSPQYAQPHSLAYLMTAAQ